MQRTNREDVVEIGPVLPAGGTRGARHPLLASVVVIAALLTGCGDDDSEGADATTTEATETTGAAEPDGEGSGDVDLTAFCDGAIEGEGLFNAGPELDEEGNPTPEGLSAFGEELQPLIDQMEQNAPEEVRSEVDEVVSTVREALESGDQAALESQEFFEADAAVDSFVYDNCELGTTAEVTAVDYGYEGMPESVPAGRVGIRLDNTGGEVHEAVMLRINDDGPGLDELLQMPEEEAEKLTEFLGVVFAPPGENASAVMDLTPGRYAMVCFIPVGTTSMEALETGSPEEGTDEGGPPHFTEGMATEFTVD